MTTTQEQIKQECQRLGIAALAKEVGVIHKTATDLVLDSYITADEDLIKQKERVVKLAPSDIPILILGETGTGKDIIARALHGDRRGQLVSVNCAGIPGELLESEFFGRVKGAYTGACNASGYIEQAQDGTLFLDEIGDMPTLLQAKLLRFLQDHRYTRLGESTSQLSNARIVSATNQNVGNMIKHKRFRLDLYYRLKGSVITLKTLRDRSKKEFDLICRYYMKDDYQQVVVDLLYKEMAETSFEGNVRELVNRIREHLQLNNN